MATTAEILADAFSRITEAVHLAVDGREPDALCRRIDGTANSIGWLVWHLSRIQDDHLADVAGTAQIWAADEIWERFAVPFERMDHGYGHSSAQVDAVRVDARTLLDYHDEVAGATARFVSALGDGDLDRIVDERWDPPVSMAVRLVSVIDDNIQHAGQALFVAGIIDAH